METTKKNGKTDQGPETNERTPGHASTLQSFARLIPKIWKLPFLKANEKSQVTEIYNTAIRNYIEENKFENVPISENTEKS